MKRNMSLITLALALFACVQGCTQGCSGISIERRQPIIELATSHRMIIVCGANEKQRETIRSAMEGCCHEMQRSIFEVAIVTNDTSHLEANDAAHCHQSGYVCVKTDNVSHKILWHEFTHARWHAVTPTSRMKLRRIFNSRGFGKNVLPKGVIYPCQGMASQYGQSDFDENWCEWIMLFLQIAHHEITLPTPLQHNADKLVFQLLEYGFEEGYLSKVQRDEVLKLMR